MQLRAPHLPRHAARLQQRHHAALRRGRAPSWRGSGRSRTSTARCGRRRIGSEAGRTRPASTPQSLVARSPVPAPCPPPQPLGQPIGPALDGWTPPPRPPRAAIDGALTPPRAARSRRGAPGRCGTPTPSTSRAATGPTCRSGRSSRRGLRRLAGADGGRRRSAVLHASSIAPPTAGGRGQFPAHRPGGGVDRGRPHQLLAAGAAHRAATEAMYLMMRRGVRGSATAATSGSAMR